MSDMYDEEELMGDYVQNFAHKQRVVSTNKKIAQLSGLLGTNDINAWEFDFISSICERTEGGKICGNLSDRQVAVLERIWNSHFAG